MPNANGKLLLTLGNGVLALRKLKLMIYSQRWMHLNNLLIGMHAKRSEYMRDSN